MAAKPIDPQHADPRHAELQSYVREAARQAGLTLPPGRLEAVTEHFARLARQAEQVLSFALDEDEQPPAVFTP